MLCPHCLQGFHPFFYQTVLYDTNSIKSPKEHCLIFYAACPECGQYMIYRKFVPQSELIKRFNYLLRIEPEQQGADIVYPKKRHKPLSQDIPKDYADEYEESYSVIDESPKASAALSRRCLQRLLEDKAHVKKNDLAHEIKEILDSKQLSTPLANAIDAIRNFGNFAAHPLKFQVTGEIVDVEPGEAQWCLEVLEMLFDFYFVQPAEFQRRKNALNQKLTNLGKPPMK